MTWIGLGKRGLLLRTRIFLVFRLPLFIWHAIDKLASVLIGKADTLRFRLLAIPAAQAVPAESREIHHVDVLHVGTLAQMLHQATECGSFQLGASRFIELR